MLYRQSDQNKINFLKEKEAESQQTKKSEISARQKENERILSQSQKTLKHKFDPTDSLMSNKSVRGSYSGVIKDTGGPNKHIGIEGQNSIWGPSKSAETVDKGQEIRANKQEIQDYRKAEKEARINELVAGLQKVDVRKDGIISKINSSEHESDHNYNLPPASFSIFDKTFDMDQKIPEHTAGEKAAQEKQAERAEQVDNWKTEGSKVVKSTDGFKKNFFPKK